jgi:tetratricopeptide (TPR) repeat protein
MPVTAPASVPKERPRRVDASAAVHEAIALGIQQARNNDAKRAAATLAGAIRSDGFARLAQDEQARALTVATLVANQSGDPRSAFEWARRACDLPDGRANTSLWHLRLSAAFTLGNYVDSARTLTTIARYWPKTLDDVNTDAIARIDREVTDDASAGPARFELLRSLFDAKWLSDGDEPSWLWADLARMQLEQGNVDAATLVVARIDSPSAFVSMRADKRFDALMQANRDLFDMNRIVPARIAHAEQRVRAQPRRLQPVIQLQYALMKVMQPERAVKIADEVVAKVAAGDGKSLYDDFDDYYNWIIDNRAAALWQLGRWDEAVAQQRRAARHPEHGRLNVSQAINLAGFYVRLGRVDDAIDAMSDLGELSPYGRMQLEAIRLVGAVQRADTREIDSRLAYLREHRSSAPGTYQDALLDAGRLDEAAAQLAERLRGADSRADALGEIQTYAKVPLLPLMQTREERRRAVVAMPSVQAELGKFGRIEEVPLASPSI